MNTNERIDCLKCKHYFITWEPSAPKGCRAFGFKTSVLPSIMVFRSSGKPCMHFETKENHKK
ncbi:uracil-DNA glycosylase [Paenibacillus sp. FSL A5-0031]|nr:uracil-DNA glycosylase [Paenibacillus sp. FSL A5-0031]